MIKQIPGLDFDTPSMHMTFGIERYIPSSDESETPANVKQFPLGPVTRFGLEDFIEDTATTNELTDVFVTREIERLVATGNYNAAYELYLSDGINDVPESFQEFMTSQTGCGTLPE